MRRSNESHHFGRHIYNRRDKGQADPVQRAPCKRHQGEGKDMGGEESDMKKTYRVSDFCVNCGEHGEACKCKIKATWTEEDGPLDPDAIKGKFRILGDLLGKLVDEKNAAYGNSFAEAGAFLRLLYPGGIATDQYDDALAIIRIIDKLYRIANKKNALGESPYKDIAGYGLLGWRFLGDGQKALDDLARDELFHKMEMERQAKYDADKEDS